MLHHHMQDDAVVEWVAVMAMSVPVTRTYMDLDVTFQRLMVGGYDRIAEIGTTVIVEPPRVDDFEGLAVFSSEGGFVHELPLPDQRYLAFGDLPGKVSFDKFVQFTYPPSLNLEGVYTLTCIGWLKKSGLLPVGHFIYNRSPRINPASRYGRGHGAGLTSLPQGERKLVGSRVIFKL